MSLLRLVIAVLAASAVLWAQGGTSGRFWRIHYTLDLTQPANHLFGVTIQVQSPTEALPATIDFQMPAWYPGRYSMYNYAVNVQNVAARCAANGRALQVTRTAPSTWRVNTESCGAPELRYRVYGNTLTGSFAQLDVTHANVNGGPVFMYIPGHKPDPVDLSIRAPRGWRVLCSLGELNQTEIHAPNYDVFIDAPIEAAPDFTLDRFTDHGKTYRVLIHSYAPEGVNHAALIAALRRIVAVENAIIGPPSDLTVYTFFFHFDPESPGDGMEHLYGTQIMIPAPLGQERGLEMAEADAAHEFFHQWNVKRLRPLALGPWDYTRPDPTHGLWIAEGITQYYGDITPERAGLVSPEAYLDELAASISSFEQQPGRALMSAADSSLTAWFHDRTPLEQETNQGATTISYYQKGELLGLMLDLDLRGRSRGAQTLDDVMRYMWRQFWQGARTSYYLPGHGYTQADFEHAVEAVSGRSYADFFRDYVSGVREIPYNQYLGAAGLQLTCQVPDSVKSYSGLVLGGGDRANRVRMVAPGSPGEQAGFGVDDVIESIDGETPGAGEAAAILAQLAPGAAAKIAVMAHLHPIELRLIPTAPRATACHIGAAPGATPAARELERQWLERP